MGDFFYTYISGRASPADNSNNQIPAGGQFEKAAAVPIFFLRFFYIYRSLFCGALSFQEETAQQSALSAYDGRVCVYTLMLDSICFCVPLQCSWMRLLYHSPLLCQQAVRLIIYGVGGASSKKGVRRARTPDVVDFEEPLLSCKASVSTQLWCGQLTLKPLRHPQNVIN